MNRRRFSTYAWAVLGYNVLVILWGAYVRATGSGAGCGRHWPLCNGELVPRAPAVETIIEYAHRTTSALAGLFVLILLVWAFRAFSRRHPVRTAAVVSFIFILIEGAVGAGLVRFEWVADNASMERAAIMAVHLTNTFILLGALTLTAWWSATVPPEHEGPVLRLRGQGRAGGLLAGGLLLILLVSAAGAVTALGDTLFPAGSLGEGVARDFAPTAHFLERLRVWHPLLAVFSALYLLTTLGLLAEWRGTDRVRRLVRVVQLLVVGQIVAGVVNLLLLAPVWMQLVHLLLADSVWIALVLLAASALEEPVTAEQPETLHPGKMAAPESVG